MGLSLVVGVLADLDENDIEGAEYYRTSFGSLNRFLASRSLPFHEEPTRCETWSSDMYGYSGLHYLRRIAAHLDLTGKLPAPGDQQADKDPVLVRYIEEFEKSRARPVGSWFRRVPRPRIFDHLIIHSDAEGYYIPADFPDVLVPPPAFEIPGGVVGSTRRLAAECQRAADALSLPLELDYGSEEVWKAAEYQGAGDLQWQRYGIESYTCLRLFHAAQHSIQTGAAIVFS